jgi:hypothetical protein
MAVEQYSLVANDWLNLEAIINDLTQRVVGQELHPTSSPTFADITLTGDLNITGDVDITGDLDVGGTVTLTGLTASRIVATNATKGLVSLASPLIVSEGGTGAATLTDGGVLLGSGTGAITAMAVLADSEMIVGNGTTDPVAESGATLRTSIGVGTGDSPTFAGLTVVNAITEFSTDGTLGGDSDSALPTEKAVKTYVDNEIAGAKVTYKYIKVTGQSEGDLHLSDGTNWNISKALIKYIRVITSSTNWDLYILQNDNSYDINDATITAMKIGDNIVENATIWLDLPYEDEDASGEVHLYWLDNSGANTADIIIQGVELA